MQRVYLDSNVFISFVKQEMGKPFRLMFQDVEDFFKSCPKKCVIVLSGLALKEIEKVVHYSKKEIVEFFEEKKIEIKIIEAGERDVEKSWKLKMKGIHYPDSLHAALALNSKCGILLTFNKKDFRIIESQIEVREPAELIP